jgi:alpha-L-fucosidase 2
VVDINWEKGKLIQANILARIGGSCAIRTQEPIIVKSLNLRSEKSSIGYILTFNAEPGKNYELTP